MKKWWIRITSFRLICLLFLLPATVQAQSKMAVNAAGLKVDTLALFADLRDLEENYGIRIYTDSTNFPGWKDILEFKRYFSYSFVNDSSRPYLYTLLQIFAKEWRKYPAPFIRNSGLTGIAFVRQLRVGTQRRYAMPEDKQQVLYYDVDYCKNSSQEYLIHSMHHEFYHLVENKHFGDFYYKDKTWQSFNDNTFQYGNGGSSAYNDPSYSSRMYPQKGFTSHYSMYGLEEDKAEIFACMMTTSQYIKLLNWMRNDQALAYKIIYFLGFLSGICPEMNLAYFSRIHNITP